MGIEHSVYVVTGAIEATELKRLDVANAPSGDGFVSLSSGCGCQVRPIYHERPDIDSFPDGLSVIPLHTLLFALKQDIYHWEIVDSGSVSPWELDFFELDALEKGKFLSGLFDAYPRKPGLAKHAVNVMLDVADKSERPYNDMLTIAGYMKHFAKDIVNIDAGLRVSIPELRPSECSLQVSSLVMLVDKAEEYFSRQNHAVSVILKHIAPLPKRDALAIVLQVLHNVDSEQCQWIAHRAGFNNMTPKISE